MAYLIRQKATTGAGDAVASNAPSHSFQATVTGTGAVTATVLIQVSNDGTNFLDLATITLSGTTSKSDGTALAVPWEYIRGNVSAISGTGAVVDVTVGS